MKNVLLGLLFMISSLIAEEDSKKPSLEDMYRIYQQNANDKSNQQNTEYEKSRTSDQALTESSVSQRRMPVENTRDHSSTDENQLKLQQEQHVYQQELLKIQQENLAIQRQQLREQQNQNALNNFNQSMHNLSNSFRQNAYQTQQATETLRQMNQQFYQQKQDKKNNWQLQQINNNLNGIRYGY